MQTFISIYVYVYTYVCIYGLTTCPKAISMCLKVLNPTAGPLSVPLCKDLQEATGVNVSDQL